MKKVLSIIAIAMLSNLANAQAFENKGNYVNFGFGLDPTGRVAATFVGYNYYNKFFCLLQNFANYNLILTGDNLFIF